MFFIGNRDVPCAGLEGCRVSQLVAELTVIRSILDLRVVNVTECFYLKLFVALFVLLSFLLGCVLLICVALFLFLGDWFVKAPRVVAKHLVPWHVPEVPTLSLKHRVRGSLLRHVPM